MPDDEVTVDGEDVSSRAELLPEEQAAGSDDALAQAEAILAESDERGVEREADPDADDVERRTSEDVTPDP